MQDKSTALSALDLKRIALVSMTINHIAAAFHLENTNYGFYVFAMAIGKLTFPIMAYLLVEGYHHTRSVKKYAARIACFWLVSIYPFWLALKYPMPLGISALFYNVLFTLLIGLLMLILMDRMQHIWQRALVICVFTILTACSDWRIVGVLMIYGFHIIKQANYKRMLPIFYTFLIRAGQYLYLGLVHDRKSLGSILPAIGMYAGILLVIPILKLYDGTRGNQKPWMKWGFYAYYPIHLLLIGIVAVY